MECFLGGMWNGGNDGLSPINFDLNTPLQALLLVWISFDKKIKIKLFEKNLSPPIYHRKWHKESL